MTTIHHYTTPEAWEQIQQDGFVVPQRNLGDHDPNKYLFALFESRPASGYTSGMLALLLEGVCFRSDEGSRSGKLIHLELDIEGVPTQVLDFQEFKHSRTAYCKSIVDLKEYNGTYRLPELIISTPIPLSRIRAHVTNIDEIINTPEGKFRI